MDLPEDLRYTKEHEWVKIEDGTATVGVTEYAQDSLGDVVYLELPQEGDTVVKDEPFGVVESVKAVSDLCSPANGTVVEVNDPLVDTPEMINDDPYGEAWLIKVEIKDPGDLDDLFTPEEYQRYIEEEK
ncbi:MAG: glycine cleavage system protein GcvH [Thermodesulfobacteriota bacterium]